jgi:hypothetical protein
VSGEKTLFLETTIQIERVAARRARQTSLRRELASYRLVTSTYVLGEYLRTLVKDTVRLHRLIAEHTHLDDVMTAIGQHPNKREASRMLLIGGIVLRSSDDWKTRDTDLRATLLERLARYAEFALLNHFLGGVDELLNITACGLARERPAVWQTGPQGAKGEDLYRIRSQCVRQVQECDLAERMTEWRPELKALAEGLSRQDDPALIRMGELAYQVLDDPTLARGRNCTWYLADLIIALELPPGVPLYTTNRRHFEPILAILGKSLHNPSQSY